MCGMTPNLPPDQQWKLLLGSFIHEFSRLEAHVFLAVGVELARADREATELLDVVTLPADEAFARARSGAINEGQSALALLMAEPVVRGLVEG